ncbi:MAG: DUF3298 domain-containing protein, partial [Oscillospiraceae bacterium]
MVALTDFLQLETPETTVRDWTVDGIPVLSAALTLPHPVGKERRQRRIARYYQQFARSYLHYCDSFLFPRAAEGYRLAVAASTPLPAFTAHLSYQVTYNQNGLFSLYLDAEERGDGGRLTVRRGDTWELSSGMTLPLPSFFPPHTPYRKLLTQLAREEVERRLEAGEASYREDWHKRLKRTFCSENYYLTQEGLCFFYQMYDLAPAVEGIPVFCLPRDDAGA